MLEALHGNSKRLLLLVGLAAVLVLVYVAIHGIPGQSRPAEADETDNEARTGGGEVAGASSNAPSGAAPPRVSGS